MVKALAMCTDSLKYGVGTDDIGLDKRPRITKTIVVVTLRGKMHHDICLGYELVHEITVADVTSDEIDLVEDGFEIVRVTCVGEFVDDGYFVFGLVLESVMYKVCPNKPCTTGN